MFYSDKFYLNNIHCDDYEIHLVSEDGGVLNEYAIPFNNDDENEITLTFCYADGNGTPMVWEEDILNSVLEWMITDSYVPFISEDNEELIYFFKGDSYVKRFTPDMTGLLDVTFKVMSPFAYKKYVKKVTDTSKVFAVMNMSNSDNAYKPIVEINKINGDISIANLSTGKDPFILKNVTVGSNVVVDNKMGSIVDSEGNILIMNSNRKWIELKKGANKFEVNGDCELIFKAYYPVMV
ncbi:MAG: hypothetical protein ACRCX8_16440 [Sarcina sp.]